MKKTLTSSRTATWVSLALFGTVVGAVFWAASGGIGLQLTGQSRDAYTREDGPAVFSPAHRSMSEAAAHFLGIRPDAEQPIAYSHQIHVGVVGLQCDFCHDAVSVGPVAGIPSVRTCMLCHSQAGTDLPEVQALVEYYDMGLEPPWERVYGWAPEAHVRFNHRPHYAAGVRCETCHGNVSDMGVAERAVEHSMGFCVDCHEQEQASNECMACHY